MKRPTILAVAALLAGGATTLFAVCPAVRKAIVADVVAPAVAIVPSYGSTYAPQAQSGASDDLLRQLLEEIRGMRRDLAALKGTRADSAINGNNLFVGDRGCIKCHEVTVADKSGGGFVMLEKGDKLAPFSLNEQKRIRSRISKGEMPPPKSGVVYSQAEKDALIGWLFPTEAKK